MYNKPMRITSGYRCSKHNAKISKTGLTGPHTTGHAVDISVSGEDAHLFLGLAFSFGFMGVGIKQSGQWSGRFIHLDDLELQEAPRPRVWTY